jgi:hypothetical protein
MGKGDQVSFLLLCVARFSGRFRTNKCSKGKSVPLFTTEDHFLVRNFEALADTPAYFLHLFVVPCVLPSH